MEEYNNAFKQFSMFVALDSINYVKDSLLSDEILNLIEKNKFIIPPGVEGGENEKFNMEKVFSINLKESDSDSSNSELKMILDDKLIDQEDFNGIYVFINKTKKAFSEGFKMNDFIFLLPPEEKMDFEFHKKGVLCKEKSEEKFKKQFDLFNPMICLEGCISDNNDIYVSLCSMKDGFVWNVPCCAGGYINKSFIRIYDLKNREVICFLSFNFSYHDANEDENKNKNEIEEDNKIKFEYFINPHLSKENKMHVLGTNTLLRKEDIESYFEGSFIAYNSIGSEYEKWPRIKVFILRTIKSFINNMNSETKKYFLNNFKNIKDIYDVVIPASAIIDDSFAIKELKSRYKIAKEEFDKRDNKYDYDSDDLNNSDDSDD